jgi:fumarylacetoacetate (FAA) hydrolase
VRDFFAFEGHVRVGFERRGMPIPPAWYDAPVFYFSNPASIRGPGEPIPKPDATSILDFELEIAAVIGGDGEIAGFTLFNDWRRLALDATVSVNGVELSRTNAAEQHWPWPSLVHHAARDTRLVAGDVIGSGTLNGGCLLELGPLEGERFLEAGDVVALEAPGFGRLETLVTRPARPDSADS